MEDELHFLVVCPTYTVLRLELMNLLEGRIPIIKSYSLDEKFKYIMKNIDRDVAHYISSCFQLRTSLESQKGVK